MKQATIRTNGIKTAFIDSGGKPGDLTVLFIHGFPFNKQTWELQLTALPKEIRAIAYDVRGFGSSEAGHHFFSVDLFARDLHQLIKALRLKRVVLCGISMGGYIALRAIEQSVEKIAGLVLCDTTSAPDSNEAKLARFKGIENIVEGRKLAYAQNSVKKLFAPEALKENPEQGKLIKSMILDTLDDVICSALLALASRTDTTPSLATIQMPVLIIHGTHDMVISREQAEILDGNIKDSRLKLIEGAGHLPNLEQPAIFNQLLLDFLTEID